MVINEIAHMSCEYGLIFLIKNYAMTFCTKKYAIFLHKKLYHVFSQVLCIFLCFAVMLYMVYW